MTNNSRPMNRNSLLCCSAGFALALSLSGCEDATSDANFSGQGGSSSTLTDGDHTAKGGSSTALSDTSTGGAAQTGSGGATESVPSSTTTIGVGGAAPAATGGTTAMATTTIVAATTGGTPSTSTGAIGTGGATVTATGGSPSSTGGAPAATGGATPVSAGGTPGATGGATAASTGGTSTDATSPSTGGALATTGGTSAATGGEASISTGGTPATTGGETSTGGTTAVATTAPSNESLCFDDAAAAIPYDYSIGLMGEYAFELSTNCDIGGYLVPLVIADPIDLTEITAFIAEATDWYRADILNCKDATTQLDQDSFGLLPPSQSSDLSEADFDASVALFFTILDRHDGQPDSVSAENKLKIKNRFNSLKSRAVHSNAAGLTKTLTEPDCVPVAP